jgi:hypothetical protein
MEINKAIERLKHKVKSTREGLEEGKFFGERYNLEQDCDAIDTVLNELDNKISKNDLLRVLRRVQDYQLNYKDTVLFNIIMQEIFGETEWINLEDKE